MASSSAHQMLLPIFDVPPIPVGAEPIGNEEVVRRLEEIAQLLTEQGADTFRIRAYRTAAQTVRELDQPLGVVVEHEGIAGLMTLPGVGRSLAHTLDSLARTGRCSTLQRLRRANSPENLLMTVADIGPALAHRIHEELGINTLIDLEAAALDGRLARLPGMGKKRVQAVRESLAGRHHPIRASVRPHHTIGDEPSVADLLDIDEQYRHAVDHERLPRVAPKSFNPTGEAWLPVLHTKRHGRQYTAMFSNSARAHELGTTHDWVIVASDSKGRPGRWTVITSAFGKLRGRRIIRGREDECAAYYAERPRLPR